MVNPTGPLSRIETVKLLLAAAEEQSLPWPASVNTNERSGIDGDISTISFRFDSLEQMQPWLDYFQVAPDWRREQVINDNRRLLNATAFCWNGWQQVQLAASDPITTAAAS